LGSAEAEEELARSALALARDSLDRAIALSIRICANPMIALATYVAHRTMLRFALSAKTHLAACVLTAACADGGVSNRGVVSATYFRLV
jgi:hypothetical protein